MWSYQFIDGGSVNLRVATVKCSGILKFVSGYLVFLVVDVSWRRIVFLVVLGLLVVGVAYGLRQYYVEISYRVVVESSLDIKNAVDLGDIVAGSKGNISWYYIGDWRTNSSGANVSLTFSESALPTLVETFSSLDVTLIFYSEVDYTAYLLVVNLGSPFTTYNYLPADSYGEVYVSLYYSVRVDASATEVSGLDFLVIELD